MTELFFSVPPCLFFKVTVTSVHTMNVSGKPRRERYVKGVSRSWKKAVVSLKEGDSIGVLPESLAPSEHGV